MQTKQVLDQGIERHFLRKCIRLGIISPPQTITKFTRNKTYAPYEFSQKDVETVWNAYAAFKMHFSDEEMKQIAKGENLPVRDSLEEHILKVQKEVEELEALIEFMKYVKGIGCFPAIPSEMIGGTSLAEYLHGLIDYLDKDRKLKSLINVAEIVNAAENINDISDEQGEEIEKLSMSLMPSDEARKLGDANHKALLHILSIQNLGAESQEVQKWIKIYCLAGAEMNRANNPEITISDYEYALGMFALIIPDSDIGLMYEKLLGKDTVCSPKRTKEIKLYL